MSASAQMIENGARLAAAQNQVDKIYWSLQNRRREGDVTPEEDMELGDLAEFAEAISDLMNILGRMLTKDDD